MNPSATRIAGASQIIAAMGEHDIPLTTAVKLLMVAYEVPDEEVLLAKDRLRSICYVLGLDYLYDGLDAAAGEELALVYGCCQTPSYIIREWEMQRWEMEAKLAEAQRRIEELEASAAWLEDRL